MKDRYNTCKKSGKTCFSEAAALRRAQLYEDIKRVYLCPYCDEWHLTSKEYDEEKGGMIKPIKEVHPDTITNRLNYLKKRVQHGNKQTR